MGWIQNVALSDIVKGHHIDPGPNCMLIQIVDPAMFFPEPKYTFKEVYQFYFLDLETRDGDDGDAAPSQEDADALVELLLRAKEQHMNVIVHCVVGVCRSGAVCEVGVILGFQDTEVYRSPNTLLKQMMMKALGVTYDAEEARKKKYEWLFKDTPNA